MTNSFSSANDIEVFLAELDTELRQQMAHRSI